MKIIYQVLDYGMFGWSRKSLGFFESGEDAMSIRKNYTYSGRIFIEKIPVFESMNSYTDYKKALTIDKIKSKLTQDELELLGLGE